jgi:hypothetical protein
LTALLTALNLNICPRICKHLSHIAFIGFISSQITLFEFMKVPKYLWAWDSVVVKVLRHYRTVPGSIPGGVTWDFFRSSFRQNHVPWGWLSLWKWVPGISPGVKAAGAFGWWPTTLVVPKVD